MKYYKKLPTPTNSAWDRKTWRSYSPIWFKEIYDGITNIFRWIPIIYKDRDWDDYYILAILRKKIEHQRKYLVEANRHMEIDRDNRYMTLALNLLERMIEEHYEIERFNYMPYCVSEGEQYMWDIDEVIENAAMRSYLSKYPNEVRKVKKTVKNPDDAKSVAFYTSIAMQEKNNRLFWKIMHEKSRGWWD